MLIVFISSLKGGGAEKVAHILASRASSKAEVIFAYVHGEEYDEPKNASCEFRKLKASSTLLSLFAFCWLVSQKKPASVIAFGNSCLIVASITRFITRCKFRLIGSERSNLSKNNKYLNKWYGLYKLVLRIAYLSCENIHCVSEGVRKDLCEVLNIPKNRTTVIVNPAPQGDIDEIDDALSKLLHSIRGPKIFAVGRLSAEKNYQLLLSSFAELQNYTECHLLIFGSGNLLPVLKRQSEELGIEDRVYFMGFVEAPFRYAKYADLFVLSSLYEGYPNALIEALSAGISVVSSDCDYGPREILVGELSDRLSRNGDQKSLTQKMHKYLSIKLPDELPYALTDTMAEYFKLLDLD